MKRKKGWIVFLFALILLVGAVYYGNSQLNKMIDTIAQSGLVEFEGLSNAVSGGAKNSPGAKSNSAQSEDPAQPAGNDPVTVDSSSAANSPAPYDAAGQPVLTPEQNRVATGVQNYLGRTVDRRDLLTAGNIVISRFSWGEINYLYGVGSRPHGKAELEKVREMCLSRLSGGDIATLRGLAGKYGLSLKILDPSVPIR